MKIYFQAIFIFILPCIPSFIYSQDSKISFEKNPEWVTPVSFDPEATPPAGQEAGYYYLLLDEQENTSRQEQYLHYVYKILTSEGIQGMSDLSIEFDPAYQKLIFHAVRVHRNGKLIDQQSNPIQTIQREQSMDRFLYDGSLTAILNLTDIRVGDIIEYAFTRKGYNPAYNGHVSKRIYFNYTIPVDKIHQRMLVPSLLPLDLEYRNVDIKPTIESTQKEKVYTWSLNHVNGQIMDSNLPDWYDGNQYVMITDFGNWGEVAAWATKHFSTSNTDKQVLKIRIDSTLKENDEDAYILKAIRFVQDEIRYLGFESGLNAHKPHSPLKVFNQRFGDCKDKSLLLCEILRLKNIEASPLLVNTTLRKKISNEVPSVNAFDHCVVQIKFNNNLYYVDPTINNQGGSLKDNSFPAYGKGLLVKETTTDLIDLPVPVTSEISEVQNFQVTSLTDEVMLNVRTTYNGMEADIARGQFSNNSLESIQKNYLTFYGNIYPDIEISESIVIHDNRYSNIFSVEENYRIHAFWKQNEAAEEVVYCDIYPQTLENYFSVIKSSQRTSPYRLPYPVSYHHHVHISLPEEWSVSPVDKIIENDFYAYEHIVRYAQKEITLQTHYETKQDFIPVESFNQFVSDHAVMKDNLAFQLSYNKNVVFNENGISWLGILTALFSFGFGLWLALRLYYYFDPEPTAPPTGDALPIGGWLILVGIGLCFSPLRLSYDLFNMPEVYDSKTWSNLLVLKRYWLYGFILLEQVYNFILLPFSVLMIVLFFKRRTSLPRLISIYYAITCFVTIADTVVAFQLDNALTSQQSYFRNMISGILGVLIWIPYFHFSSRVKETFVRRVNEDDYNIYAPEGSSDSYQSIPGNNSKY